MKSRRRLIVLLAGLIVFLAAALEFISRFYLSELARPLIQRELSSATGCAVELGSVRLSLFRGIAIDNLSMRDAGGMPVLSVEKTALRPRILPLLLLRFDIRTAKLARPVLTLSRDAEGKWNLAGVVHRLSAQRREGSAPPSSIRLRDGRLDVRYSPHAPDEPAAEKIDVDLSFSADGTASYRGKIIISVSEGSGITIAGTYNPSARQNALKAVGKDILLAQHLPFLREISGVPLQGTEGKVAFDVGVNLSGGGEVRGNGTVSLVGVRISDPTAYFSGNLSMEGSFYTDGTRTPIYQGTVRASSSTLKLAVVPREFTDVAGLVTFSGNMMSSTNLTGSYSGHPVRAMGTITDFSSPELDLRVNSTVEINRILEIFGLPPDVADSGAFSGMSETEIFIRGKLAAKEPLLLTGAFKVSDGAVSLRRLPPVGDITGTAYLIADEVVIRDAQGLVGDQSVSIKGNIGLAAEPAMDLTISSPDSLISLRGTVVKDSLHLESLSGNLGASTFAISGVVRDFDNPSLDLSYKGEINLDKLRQLMPKGATSRPLFGLDFTPKGSVSLGGTISGDASRPEQLSVALEGSSYSLELASWFINSVSFSADMRDGLITVDEFAGIVNQGTLSASGSFDTRGEKALVSLVSSAKGINFRGKMPESSEEEIYGTLTGEIQAEGFPDNPPSLSGSGKVLIERGKIWQLDFFKGLQDILRVVQPNVGSVVFDRISGTFTLKDGYIESNDIVLDSPTIKLYPKGRLGLDGTLDCVMDVQLFTTRGNLVKKVTGTIMNISGELVAVKLTGTLRNPRWRPIMLPFIRDIKKTGQKGTTLLKKALPGKSGR